MKPGSFVRVVRWHRLLVDGQVRSAAILTAGLALAVASALTAWVFLTPDRALYQVPAWGWVHWGTWDYTVRVKPNSIFETRELGPDRTYYEALVEGIDARFSYTFATDTAARLQGWYEVTALLNAGEGLSERYLLFPRTPFLKEGARSAAMEAAFPVDRAFYRQRVQELAAETGTPAPANPTVTYAARVEVTALVGGESTIQSLEPTLVVPLSGPAFTLTGDRSLSKSGIIRRPEARPLPQIEARRRYALVGLGVLAPLPLLLALATRPTPGDPLAQEVRRLRRKYGKRIAQAGPGGLPLPGAEAVPLASVGELARVSEELLKPIIYSGPATPGGEHLFFVVDGATRYEYRLAPPRQ